MKNSTDKNNKSDFLSTFTDVNFEFSLRNLRYLPRWFILLLDLMIVMVAGIITYMLFIGLKLNFIPIKYLSFGIVFYFVVNLFFFWIYRTYSGIIRHSSYIDALKLFFSQFSTFVILLVLNFILIVFDKQKLYLTTGAFINALLSFSLLFFIALL